MSEQDPRQDPRPSGSPTSETASAVGSGQVSATEVGRLELREERAFVEKRREQSGQVRVRREVERRVETVAVELLTETVVIEVLAGASGVFLDGQPLLEGETREIVTYREEAEVQKKAVVSEEVRLLKRVVNTTQNFTVDLGREVLRVERAGVPGETAPGITPGVAGDGAAGDRVLGGEETV